MGSGVTEEVGRERKPALGLQFKRRLRTGHSGVGLQSQYLKAQAGRI